MDRIISNLCHDSFCSHGSQTLEARITGGNIIKNIIGTQDNGKLTFGLSTEFIQNLLDSYPSQDLNLKDTDGETVLSLALKSGQDTVVTILMASGVDGTDIDSQGNSLLHLAFKLKSWKKYISRMKDCMNRRNEFPLQSMAENNVLLDRETFKRIISTRTSILREGTDRHKLS